MPVTAKKHTEIIEPGDDTLQLYPIDQEDREWNLVLADKIEKRVLQVLWPLCSHVSESHFVLGAVGQRKLLIKSTGAPFGSRLHFNH